MLANPATTALQTNSIQQDAYTDLNALNKINQIGRSDQSAALKELSKQFESIFMSLMLKSMRQASAPFEEGGLFSSNDMKFYRDMYDQQLTLDLTESGGIGLAQAFYDQMQSQFNQTSSQTDRRVTSIAPQNRPALESHPSLDAAATFSPPYSPPATSDLPTARFGQFSGEPKEFVSNIYPFMKRAGQELGVDPDVLVAQAALETGWGKHIATNEKGYSSNNLFNIKADSRWDGGVVNVSTIEFRNGIAERERASFRQYNSINESVRDYVDFIKNNPRYESALNASSRDEYVKELQSSGYATDPHYANKILEILDSDIFDQAALSNGQLGPRG